MNWHNIFQYTDGKLYWKIKVSKKVVIGTEAGTPNHNGYLRVSVYNKRFYVHRVIYEMFHGPLPKKAEVDHVNGVRSDNKIENLRKASSNENQWNRSKSSNNTSGYIGVHYFKRTGQYTATIWQYRKRKHLGYFPTAEDAYNARLTAEKAYHKVFAQSACRV